MRTVVLMLFMSTLALACSSSPLVPEVDDSAARPADILGQGQFCCPFYEPSADAWHYCCAPGTVYEAAFTCMTELQADGHLVDPPYPTPAAACTNGLPPMLDPTDEPPPDVFDPPGPDIPIVVFPPKSPNLTLPGLPKVVTDVWWSCRAKKMFGLGYWRGNVEAPDYSSAVSQFIYIKENMCIPPQIIALPKFENTFCWIGEGSGEPEDTGPGCVLDSDIIP